MAPNKVLKFAIGPLGLGVLGFVSVPVISWFFPPADIGVLAMLQVAVNLALMLVSLGLDQAYAREYHSVASKRRLFVACFVPGMGSLLLLSVVFYFVGVGDLSVLIFGVKDSALSWIFMVALLFGFLVRYVTLYYRLTEDAVAFSVSQIVPKIAFIFLALASSYLSFASNYIGLAVAHVSGLAAVIILFILSRGFQSVRVLPLSVECNEISGLLKYGLPLMVSGLAAWALRSFDRIALRSFSSLEELGVYSVAVTIAGGAALFASVFNIIWAPTIYKLSASEVDKSKIAVASNVVQLVVFLLVAVTGAIAPIVPFFLPPVYSSVGSLIPLCVFVPLFYSLSEASTIGINLSKKTGYAVYATAVAFIFSLAANYFLVPIYGALGAAISTASAFLVYLFVRYEFSRLVWDAVPRGRIYGMSALSLALAVTTASSSFFDGRSSMILWVIFGMAQLFFYSAELLLIKGFFQRWLKR